MRPHRSPPPARERTPSPAGGWHLAAVTLAGAAGLGFVPGVLGIPLWPALALIPIAGLAAAAVAIAPHVPAGVAARAHRGIRHAPAWGDRMPDPKASARGRRPSTGAHDDDSRRLVIRLRRDGTVCWFTAEEVGAGGDSRLVSASVPFAARGRSGASATPAARAAHDALVRRLKAKGWKVSDRGGEWQETALRRSPTAPSRRAPAREAPPERATERSSAAPAQQAGGKGMRHRPPRGHRMPDGPPRQAPKPPDAGPSPQAASAIAPRPPVNFAAAAHVPGGEPPRAKDGAPRGGDTAVPTAPTGPAPGDCRIVCTRLGREARLQAVVRDEHGVDTPFAASPPFPLARHGRIRPTRDAQLLHQALVRHLEATGWHLAGGAGTGAWYAATLRRSA